MMDEQNNIFPEEYKPEAEYAPLEQPGQTPAETNQEQPAATEAQGAQASYEETIPYYTPKQYSAPPQSETPQRAPSVPQYAQPQTQQTYQQPQPSYPAQAPQPQRAVNQPYYPQQAPSQQWQRPAANQNYVPQNNRPPIQYAGQSPYQPPQPQPQQPNMNYNPYINDPSSPYAGQYSYPQPAVVKTSGGTKAFIAILSSLLAVVVIVFVVYVVFQSKTNKQENGFSLTDPTTIINEFPNGIGGNGGNITQNSKEFDAEVTLLPDNGETQQRDSDNPESVGAPDEKAKAITLEPLPKDKGDSKYTTQAAYDAVSDSVVSIVTYKEKITGNTADMVGQGSGTVISSDGYIVTNAHVIGNWRGYLVNVILGSDEEYQAKIVGFDTWTDLAVLKIDASGLTPVSFGDSKYIEIGDDVIAIGNPGINFKNSLTKGIVSALNREISINKNVKYIQSDCVINPGNSGGPLCNIYGQVIGITSAKITMTHYESMSFSIPSETVCAIINDLMRYGYVRGRVRLGFSGYELSSEDTYYYSLPQGVVVTEIADDSSLMDTDIKADDIITAVDGIEISSFQDIYDILADHKEGDKIKLSVYRTEQ